MIHLACQYFLNHRLDITELRKQVRELIAAGYESIYAHSRQGLETPYFSEAWWDVMRLIVEECRIGGVKFSIWDEDYFPSPLAGGRLIWNNPEFAAQQLDFILTEVSTSGEAIKFDLKPEKLLRCFAIPRRNNIIGQPIDVTGHCGTVSSGWSQRGIRSSSYTKLCKIPAPHWRTNTLSKKHFSLLWQPDIPGEYVILAVHVLRPDGGHNTDLLNPYGMRKFIEYTHEEYARRFDAKTFSETFDASFMDEPAPSGFFPWTDKFEEEFTQEHGYDLLSLIPHLAMDIDDRTPLIRHHYRMTQMRLQCTNYLQQTADWCHAHGIKSVGHLTRTEYLGYVAVTWPNELRCCKYLDIPCTDPLGAAVAWPDAAAYHTGLKVVSSAAHIFGKEQAGSDALAVMGNEASLRDLRFHLDYQMVMGINYFNVHGLCYSFDGPRKDEAPPSLFYQHTEWKYMSALLQHVKSVCTELSGGTHLCRIGVLYPATSIYCKINLPTLINQSQLEEKTHRFSEAMLSHQKDFDFIDEITLQEFVGKQDKIELPEPWQVIILPYLEYIEQQTAECLKKLAAAGIMILVLGSRPKLLGELKEQPQTVWNPDFITFADKMNDEILEKLPGVALKGDGSQDVFALQRQKDSRIITFLVNRAEREFNGTFEMRDIRIAPKGSLLFDNELESSGSSESQDLPQETFNSDWHIDFETNQLPLCYWFAADIAAHSPDDSMNDYEFSYDLLRRQNDPMDKGINLVRYQFRFLFSGENIPIKLVLEASSIGGNWELFVNETKIDHFTRERVYDCMNVTAEIGHAFRTGTSPALNTITITSEGEGRGLFEMPYLYGNFKCEYRHGHESLPYLNATDSSFELPALQSWHILGYQTFSGTACYSKNIKIEKEGEYWLDLGRVEDVADVFIDETHVALLPWPPYSCSLGKLSAGTHKIRIEITNCPGNRDRVSNLPSGLLGPVKFSTKTVKL